MARRGFQKRLDAHRRLAEVEEETKFWQGQVLFYVDEDGWEFRYDVPQMDEPNKPEDFEFRLWNRRTFDDPNNPWLRWTQDQGSDVEVPSYVYNYFLG